MNIPAGTSARGNATLAIPNIQLDMTGATENGSSFAVTNLTQDGYAPGQLTGIQVANNGIVQARYSNGQSKPAGQVELASFRNPQGLQTMGGNVWIRTVASGDAVVGVPGDGNMGALQSGALEESNVDLTAELVNMVTAQRAYQANAQTIKTQDQVLQTIVNLR
jgi:flagellar hook protein FlgE